MGLVKYDGMEWFDLTDSGGLDGMGGITYGFVRVTVSE